MLEKLDTLVRSAGEPGRGAAIERLLAREVEADPARGARDGAPRLAPDGLHWL